MLESALLNNQEAEIDTEVSRRKRSSRLKQEADLDRESSESKPSSRCSEDESPPPPVDAITVSCTTSGTRSVSPPVTSPQETARTNFFKLPAPPPACFPVNCVRGWSTYLTSRWSGDSSIVSRVSAEPCILAGLTYPLTIAYLLACLKFAVCGELTVVVLGAMCMLEERLLRETGYWGEIAVCLRCRVHLVFVGPNVSETNMSGEGSSLMPPNPDSTRCSLFRGTFTQLQRQYPSVLTAKSTVCVAYNAGFGDCMKPAGLSLLYSWLDDLRAVVNSRLPAFFTQANEEAELKGETALMAHVLGARFVVLPTQNPFLASAGQPTSSSSQVRSCANHSFYAVQGCDVYRESCRGIDVTTSRGRQALLTAAKRAMRLDTRVAALEKMTTPLDQTPVIMRPQEPALTLSSSPHRTGPVSPKGGWAISQISPGGIGGVPLPGGMSHLTTKGIEGIAKAPPLGVGMVPLPSAASQLSPHMMGGVPSTATVGLSALAQLSPKGVGAVRQPAAVGLQGLAQLPPRELSALQRPCIDAEMLKLQPPYKKLKQDSPASVNTNLLTVPNYRLEVKPEQRVVHAIISLALLDTAKQVDLEVYQGELLVSVHGIYDDLRILLPSPVDEDQVVATFNRSLRELEVKLSIQSSPRPLQTSPRPPI